MLPTPLMFDYAKLLDRGDRVRMKPRAPSGVRVAATPPSSDGARAVRCRRFETPGSVSLQIKLPSGRVVVTTVDEPKTRRGRADRPSGLGRGRRVSRSRWTSEQGAMSFASSRRTGSAGARFRSPGAGTSRAASRVRRDRPRARRRRPRTFASRASSARCRREPRQATSGSRPCRARFRSRRRAATCSVGGLGVRVGRYGLGRRQG